LSDEEWSTPSNGTALFLVENWQSELNTRPIKSLWEWSNPEAVPVRISISGAAGTGKKRLARDLSDELDITAIESIERSVFKLGGKLNKGAEVMDEFMLFLAHLWEETEYMEFASAGSVIDIVAYCHYIAARSDDPRWKFLLRGLTNLANTYVNNQYTVFFYIPYKNKPRGDGIRSVDDKFQREIDRLIRHYLTAFDLDYFPITGTRDEKKALALDYLESFGLEAG